MAGPWGGVLGKPGRWAEDGGAAAAVSEAVGSHGGDVTRGPTPGGGGEGFAVQGVWRGWMAPALSTGAMGRAGWVEVGAQARKPMLQGLLGGEVGGDDGAGDEQEGNKVAHDGGLEASASGPGRSARRGGDGSNCLRHSGVSES